jgi:ribose 5-phosphate isomerase B
MTQRVALGADHGGFALKAELVPWLREQGYEVSDLGAHTLDPADDYPDFAAAVARAVASEEASRGIVICGSGVGACIVANKITGIRACLCHDTYSARQGVEHDNVNVLCLGARVIGGELARELVSAFLGARFSAEARHRRRLDKVLAIEAESMPGKKVHKGRGE